MKQIDWVPPGETDHLDDTLYRLDELRARFEVRELARGWLVLNFADPVWIRFAAMAFARSNTDGSDTRASCVFHGDGPVGNLRECRHTYWGEDGYIFCPHGPTIAAAFRELAEFFDDMAIK